MAFADFLAAIEASNLREVATHWNDARGTKRMPRWEDIDPAKIAPHLSIIWAWKYERETDTFIGRLAGDAIIEAHRGHLRGKRMQDFFAGDQYAEIFSRNRRVVTEPAFARETGKVLAHMKRYGLGERIIMPLATDGAQGDGILGATIYSINPNAPLSGVQPDPHEDAMRTYFFALD